MTGMRLMVAVAITLVAQLAFVPRISIAGITPDFVVLLVVLVALRAGPSGGAALGFLVGLLQGMLAPETLGLDALAKTLVGWAVGKLSSSLAIEGPAFYFGLVAMSVLAHDLVYLVGLTQLDVARFLGLFVTHSIPAAVYTGLVSLLIGMIARAVTGGVLNRTAEVRRG
ncbi:MAG TPA: rod shape-determining protein MreD [Candidatus Krumholzibacteria bacterium]|nr:rod shape-determining protein MreD [Candidatus Krumholzibacteria bacterium]